MKQVVEGKDWQQQDALVPSHSREDTEVRSICKNLRLLKVKLTTNPPQYICTGQCSRVLSLAALTKSLQKYSCILVTYHQLSTIPIYLQDHFNRGKEKERLCDSKPVPRKRKSWTLVSRSFQCDSNVAAHPLEKILSSAPSSFVLLHHPLVTGVGVCRDKARDCQGIARATRCQPLCSPFLQLPVRSMWNSGSSLVLQWEDLLLTHSHSSWKRVARRQGESPLPLCMSCGYTLCLILLIGELLKSHRMPEPLCSLSLKAEFTIEKEEQMCTQLFVVRWARLLANTGARPPEFCGLPFSTPRHTD